MSGPEKNNVAVISDIHGNLPALESVLEEIDKIGAASIVCLGDVCGYYCQVNECIELLRERKVFSLLGNHDYYLLTDICCDSKTVKMCLDYQKTIISESSVAWLKGLPVKHDTGEASYRHGGWNDFLEERIDVFNFEDVSELRQRLFFSGHTHIQGLQSGAGRVYCNPGSVGQPRDHDPRAAFAVIHGSGEVELRRTLYDIDHTAYEMKKAGLGSWIWKCLYDGKRIGEK